MKSLFAIFTALFALTVSAQSTVIYDFTKADEGKKWSLENAPGYKPAPQFTYNAAEKAWCIEKVQGQGGFLYKNNVQKVAVKDGDVLTVTCEVKGRGPFSVTGEYFSKTKWISMYPGIVTKPLKNSWNKQTVQLIVKDAKKQGIDTMVIYFGGARSTTLWIKNITVTVKSAK